MEYLKKIIKNEYAILAIVILVAIFLRSYQHKNFLGFHLDQSRDAIIVGDFIDDFSKIPLLGPHTSGSNLQLGPAYYYLQAIPVFFLGKSPENFALADWFFSILFVWLLYFFLRLYFSKNISLLLSAMAAVSLFLVIYGRFAWNPNSLPFLTLLALFGLLKADWKNTVRPEWFYLGIFGAAVATQLHYVYFFMAPIIFIAYIAVWKPRLKIKHYLAGILIILAVYFPMVISEIKTGGANTQLLIKNTFERGLEGGDNKHNVIDKAFYAYQKLQMTNWQIITSDEHGSSMQLSKKFIPVCKKECRNDFPFFILQTFLFVFGLWAGISSYRREQNRDRKKYIFSTWLWLGSMFIISIPIIYNMSPHYYLAAAAPCFVFLGISLQKTSNWGKYGKIIILFLSAAIILFNLRNTLIYLREHAASAKGEVENTIGRELYNDKKITLEQLEETVKYIKEHRNPNTTVRIAADNSYARAVFYLLKHQENIPACYTKTSAFHPSGSLDYFLVYRLGVNQEMPQDLEGQFSIRSQEKIGNLLIIDAEAKNPGGKPGKDEKCFDYL
ncbi:MAG: glycosyltransferase family 39 protein [Parcubacteria group bacterium]|jgi:hypothetical protein